MLLTYPSTEIRRNVKSLKSKEDGNEKLELIRSIQSTSSTLSDKEMTAIQKVFSKTGTAAPAGYWS